MSNVKPGDVVVTAGKLWHCLTLERLVTAIVFLAIFAMAARFPFDTDSWWHLESGRWIVDHKAVPRVDPFSHTRFGQPWIDHGWLPQTLFFIVFSATGYAGLVVLLALLVTSAFYLSWLQAPGTDRWLRAFVFVTAVVASGIIWAIRPQMVSFLLTALFAYVLYRFKQGRGRALFWLPLVMLLWVNSHGGFALGFLLLAAHLFGETGNQLLRRGEATDWRGPGYLLLVTVLCVLVLPLNPNTFQMWSYPFRTVGMGVLREFIQEWQSPNFHALYLHPFIWLLLAALTAFGLAGRRADFTDLTVVALFAYLSLLAVRNIPIFALLAAPIIVRYGSEALRSWRREGLARQRRPLPSRLAALNWLLLLLLAALALGRVAMVAVEAGEMAARPEGLPVAAVAYLDQEKPRGAIFNNYNWGGYLIWRLPAYPVFVDGRTDLYDDELLRDYLAIYLAKNDWERRLAEYGVNLVLVEPEAPLAGELAENAAWQQSYGDEQAVVFRRR